MPTYDYRCKACGHAFELFQSMSEGVKRKCPACSKLALERLIGTGAGMIFKGSGFYQTDYRSDSYKAGEKAEKKAAEPKEKGGEKRSSGDSGGSATKKAPPKSEGKDAD